MDGMLSQEEINALFSGMDIEEEPATDTSSAGMSGEVLTAEEKDAIGEISNISLGSSATTLFALVNQRVNISTPTVSVCKWDDLSRQYGKPCVFIQISYKEGLDGKNVLILQEKDVCVLSAGSLVSIELILAEHSKNVSGLCGLNPNGTVKCFLYDLLTVFGAGHAVNL